jgi:hypothetical protein
MSSCEKCLVPLLTFNQITVKLSSLYILDIDLSLEVCLHIFSPILWLSFHFSDCVFVFEFSVSHESVFAFIACAVRLIVK